MEIPTPGTMTFLFTDIEGSTRLWERYPDAMREALKRHDAILQTAVAETGGQVVKTTGDGMMAVFGSAVDAVTTGLVAQRQLGGESWGETGPLRVRMGLHSGQAQERASDFFGPAINRTARIMAVGHGGQVLLSASTAALAVERLPAGAGLLDLGQHRLKDLGRPERLFQLTHPDLAAGFPPLASMRAPGASLPVTATELVGRRAELAQIEDLLTDRSVRLLTLIGPGGTGKTTLAIRVAADLSAAFPDGVFFVDLSTARHVEAVLIALARAVGIGDVIDRPLQEELADRLRDARTMLVLDNFEQVTEAAAAVARLLGDCPDLTVLTTSREALHVRAERVYSVPPLALPPVGAARSSTQEIADSEAVQLFIDRAATVQPGLQLTDDNASAVAEICRRLDGLPLPIELAAARMRLFSPEVLRDRLDDRLGLLRSGPRDLPERQQTLRATMDWSFELLEPAEQRLFEFLAAFADAAVEAVEAVADDLGEIEGVMLDPLGGLEGLIEKSLVRQVDGPAGEPRVAMLETIREFAGDRLAQRPEFASRVRRAHATHYADLARRLRPDLTGPQRDPALATVGTDLGNLRIAWAFWVSASDLEQLDKLADTLLLYDDAHGWYLDTIGLTSDMLAVLDRAPSSSGRLRQEISLRTSLARALMTTKGFTPEVEAAFARVQDLFEQGADVGQQYPVLRGLASLYLFRAQSEEAGRLGQELLTLGAVEHNRDMLIDGHLLVGVTVMTGSDLRAGLDHFDQAIALFPVGPTVSQKTRVGSDPRIPCLTTSAIGLWLMGYPDRSAERLGNALALADRLEHPFTSAYARFHAGLLRLWRREPGMALQLASELLELADEHDFRIWTAAGSCLHGAARVELGETDDGLASIRSGVDLYQELRSPPIFWPFLLSLDAAAKLRAGRASDGLRSIDASIEILSAAPSATLLPELHLLKGDLVALRDEGGGPAAAEPWYRLAFERANGLDARMTALRAATRLGRLFVADGERGAAASLIGPVYAGFTEGLSTADLLDAKALLAA